MVYVFGCLFGWVLIFELCWSLKGSIWDKDKKKCFFLITLDRLFSVEKCLFSYRFCVVGI